ncbi:MAG TPA: flavin reductase family protein [Candidatus Aquicultor sp.]|jgi:flavin reductase (DIM6/NTAB) family NADH-FMN oxidoreductase RutF
MGKKLVTGVEGLLPLPLALVTVANNENIPDIFSASWLGVMCPDPLYIGVGIDAVSYAHELIEDNAEFAINIMEEGFVKEIDELSRLSGHETDKFEEARLTAQPAKEIKAPIILESAISIECKVQHVLRLGTHDLYIGRVLATHVEESVLDGNSINVEVLRPVVYAVDWYWSIGRRIGQVGRMAA